VSRTETEPAARENAGETWRERVAYRGYATVAWLGATLPTGVGRPLFRFLGTVAYRFGPSSQREIVLENQARVIGRPVEDPLVQASAREAYRRYARYWYDAFAVVTWSDEEMLGAFEWDGEEYLLEPTRRGQGVIAVLPHMGNWDASGRAMRARGLPMVAVAERLKPERLFQLFVRQREASGIRIVALGQSGGVGKQLTAAIEQGNVLALLADRDLTGRGVTVEMFGAVRRMPAGPAMLALSTGAPIVVVGSFETADGWRGLVRPLAMPERTGDRRADVRAITQAIADAFERVVAASPVDWHLFQPGWPADES
jgi:phosphatidylinositol dimannoside acyltransferase